MDEIREQLRELLTGEPIGNWYDLINDLCEFAQSEAFCEEADAADQKELVNRLRNLSEWLGHTNF